MFALECRKCMYAHLHTPTDMNVSVAHSPNVNSSFLQSGVIIPCIGSSCIKRRSLKNESIVSNLLPPFDEIEALGFSWVMSQVAFYTHRLMLCTPKRVECIQCVVGYAQNENERKNYCMCAARTSKIEFSTTVNSTHNHSLSLFHSFSRSPAYFHNHIHIDAMRCKFVLVVPICVLDKRSLSLLCFGSALLLLFRIFFMRSGIFSLRSHSVLMV